MLLLLLLSIILAVWAVLATVSAVRAKRAFWRASDCFQRLSDLYDEVDNVRAELVTQARNDARHIDDWQAKYRQADASVNSLTQQLADERQLRYELQACIDAAGKALAGQGQADDPIIFC